jgi:4-hydroxy 2-oxovalerate aldolase
MSKRSQVTLLDATLRDGGYLNNWEFSENDFRRVVVGLDRFGVDVIEVGYARDGENLPLAWSSPPSLLAALVEQVARARLAIMIQPDVPDLQRVLESRCELVDFVRVPTQISLPGPGIEAARLAADLRVETSINLTNVSAFSDRELEDAVRRIGDSGAASVIYLADSRGAMSPDEVKRAISVVREVWPGRLGFHPHDNQGLALENASTALTAGCTWIDGTVKGYGIGGQNASLGDLASLVSDRRPAFDRDELESLEAGFELPDLLHPRELYALAGRKNLKQEWVEELVERLGGATSGLLRALPRRRYLSVEEVLGEMSSAS